MSVLTNPRFITLAPKKLTTRDLCKLTNMPMTPAEATTAMERNAISFFSAIADLCPGATIAQTEDVKWFRTGLRHYFGNVVIRWSMPTDQLNAFIADTLAIFDDEKLPLLWFAGPSMIGEELSEAFTKAGIICASQVPGMVAELDSLNAETTIDVRPVDSEASLDDWVNTVLPIFDIPDFMSHLFRLPFTGYGFGKESPFRAFVAYVDGVPVGTSALHISQGVGGIYCVGTSKGSRGKGVGYAVTLAAMQEARSRGLDFAVLQASPLGEPVYKRLGFVETCRFEMWIANYPPKS